VLEFRDMISNLTIKGFRAFRELRVAPLTRVNLFVGANNAGKTTVLEAVELLAASDPETLRSILRRRREELLPEGEGAAELDPSRLFHGHELTEGRSFRIEQTGKPAKWFECRFDKVSIRVPLVESLADLYRPSQSAPATERTIRALALSGDRTLLVNLPVSKLGGLIHQQFEADLSPGPMAAVQFIGTERIDHFRMGQIWDKLVLTENESILASSLRFIEPQIERIAFIGENRREARRAFIKLSNPDHRLPLGTLGEGVGRLLNLVLHLVDSKEGYLLVDEIDTGLHYSVMTEVWRLVIETARRLKIQVFATTHSADCVHALAWAQEKYPDLAADVTLHRVQNNMNTTVVYTADEIAIAERGRIEVR
jgi:hypothetical protein